MTYDSFDVPVTGGDLHVGRWTNGDGPVVLAVHGVTGNHRAWAWVAGRLPGTVLAPDLRGRGRSQLTGSAGMSAHAADLAALLDHLEVDRVRLVGHSMGAFVAAAFVEAQPERAEQVLLVDGGLPLPAPPEGMTPEQVLAATIGPAADRLRMTFADKDAYFDFFRPHPALGPAWSEGLEDYLAYDLQGEPPECRSRVSIDAVRDDSADLLDMETVGRRATALPEGTLFLRAPAGLMAEPGGLYPPELVEHHAAAYPNLTLRDVEGTNHYTIVMGDVGAQAIAEALTS